MSKETIKKELEETLAKAELEKQKFLQIIKDAADGVIEMDRQIKEIRTSLIS